MNSTPSYGFPAVNAFLLQKQHLTPRTRIGDVLQIVRDTAGLHATSGTTPYLSLLARCRAFERESLDRELCEVRTLARVRCVRGTLYIQPRDWIAAYLAATRRRNLAQTRAYARWAGIDDRRYAALSVAITGMLAGTSLPAAEIRRALGFRGDISAVLYRMCDEGLLLRDWPKEGWSDRALHYRLFREVFPDVAPDLIDEPLAVRAVMEQYLRCFGPASEEDIAWWSGFGKNEVRRAHAALAGRLAEVRLGPDRRPALLLQEDLPVLRATGKTEGPVVSLLPVLDGYLMGYRERERYLRPEHRSLVFDRGGNVTSTILVDGAIVGVWDWEAGSPPRVRLHLLTKVDRKAWALIEECAQGVGRFLGGQEVEILRCGSMIPLVKRGAGGFLSPLREGGSEKRVVR